MKFSFFKKKKETPERQPEVVEAKKVKKSFKWPFSGQKLAEKMTPVKMATIAGIVVFSVFVLHAVISAFKAHEEYKEQASVLHPEQKIMHKRYSKLPSVVESEEQIYLGLARLSELAPIKFNGAKVTGKTFKSMATKVTVARDLYMAKIKVVVSGPISMDLFLLPFIQSNLQKHNSVLTEIMYNKGGSGGRNSEPKMTLFADIYGSSPLKRSQAEEGVTRENGFKNYVKKF